MHQRSRNHVIILKTGAKIGTNGGQGLQNGSGWGIFKLFNPNRMSSVLNRIRQYFSAKAPPPPVSSADEFPVDEALFNNYSFVIGSVFSYFNDLSPENRMRFITRVHHFK